MERVQFQQEQMLTELKDFAEKKIFTQAEIKQIMKKRTAFETALVRRVAKKTDFLRYAAYEMGLEQLRRKRVERMKLQASSPSVSDYALVRRQFHIFERALKKFKSDVGLWVQYIQVAKREGARALVGRITARALQLHPNVPALYILAASHELAHLSPSAARSILQRGIRLNAHSIEIWREYVKMELGFIESLRRRWNVLGIDVEGKGKAVEIDVVGNEDGTTRDGVLERMEEDAVTEGDEGDAVRREIMQGAIVKSVISSAAKALPKMDLFLSLDEVLKTYPSPLPLKEALIKHLQELVASILPGDAEAIKMFAMSGLAQNLTGEALVEALKAANERLLRVMTEGAEKEEDREELYRVYAAFVGEWHDRSNVDEHLKRYLISSLHSFIQRTKSRSPSLLSTHIRILVSDPALAPPPAKVVHVARKYASRVPESGKVGLARLEAEKGNGTREEVERAWAEVRRAVCSEDSDVERVWTWGLDGIRDYSGEERRQVHEVLLKESMRDSSLGGVYETILIRYIYAILQMEHEDDVTVTARQNYRVRTQNVRRTAGVFLTTGRVWKAVFDTVKERGESGSEQVLEEVYEEWRTKDLFEAAVAWAGWLRERGSGKRAQDVIVNARSCLSGTERDRLEVEWRKMLN